MSMLLSLHPIKSFERQRPESLPRVTSRQGERAGGCLCMSEKQRDIYRQTDRERRQGKTDEAARQRTAATALSPRPGSYLITGYACWEKVHRRSRREGHREPGASRDMISNFINTKTQGEKDFYDGVTTNSTCIEYNHIFFGCKYQSVADTDLAA